MTRSQTSNVVRQDGLVDDLYTFPSEKAGQNHSSLLRRLTLLGLIMAMLVAAAGGVSFWFANRASQNMQLMRQTAEQSMQMSDMQSSWLAIVGALDTLSINQPSEGSKKQLDTALAELEHQLETLAASPLGSSPAIVEENREIIEELRGIGVEVADMANEIYPLSEQNRSGTALQRRQVRLEALQARLDTALARLNSNLQEELTVRSLWIERQQALARFLSLAVVSLAFILALGVAWVSRRTLVKPLQVLIGEVKRITSGDFTPVAPLQRTDEIGELSRSVALMTQWLNESYDVLERRVDERTQELQRLTTQLQVAAAVARDMAGNSNLDKLLISAANLIRERFGFYHAGIFLSDARSEYAVLHAATGEAGRDMLQRQHKLRIGSPSGHSGSGSTGLVGRAAETGEAQLARDVALDPYHYKNPLLPDTRSEVALPLKIADRVIGVLDVQSQTPDAFDEQSIEILQVMADQLAIAIQNARLLQEVRENLNELQLAYGQIERREWTRLSTTSPVIGFDYNGVEINPISAQDASRHRSGETTGNGQENPLRIPLRVRGEVIGSLDVWSQSGELSEAEVYLLATISSRLSQVMEGARLLGQAQRTAAREHLTGEITAQMRSTNDPQAILQIAARELRKALQADKAQLVVRAVPAAPLSPSEAPTGDPS